MEIIIVLLNDKEIRKYHNDRCANILTELECMEYIDGIDARFVKDDGDRSNSHRQQWKSSDFVTFLTAPAFAKKSLI